MLMPDADEDKGKVAISAPIAIVREAIATWIEEFAAPFGQREATLRVQPPFLPFFRPLRLQLGLHRNRDLANIRPW